ncbi:MAG: hypothetical protein IT522_12320 [Burkholderiales bacterium]|nr:hypothetical protein [Burkholderiales bacterium]
MLALLALVLCASPASGFTPASGQWWNPDESGTGYNIDVSAGVLVVTVFSFNANGDSQWYLAAGPMSADQRRFTGTLDRYRNGQCISCGYAGRPASVGNDGVIAIDFTSETSATLTLPGGRTTAIQPLFARPASTSLQGTYRLKRGTVDYLGGPLLDTASGNLAATGTMVIAGNQLMQTVSVIVNGVTSAISFSGTYTDFGTHLGVIVAGVPGRVTLVSRGGDLLIMASVNPAIGTAPPYAEVDQWELIGAATASIDRMPGKLYDVEVRLGAPLAAALAAHVRN